MKGGANFCRKRNDVSLKKKHKYGWAKFFVLTVVYGFEDRTVISLDMDLLRDCKNRLSIFYTVD